MILVFSLVTVFIALGSQLGSILGAFWLSSGVQNPSKIDFKPIPTTYQKMIAFWIALGTDLIDFWYQLGSILEPNWLQVGPQVGPKSNLDELGPNLAELGSILAPTWPLLD